MSFNIKIRFTGLCGYVPDEELGDPSKEIKTMRIVMPDALVEGKKRALDRRKLERHMPFVKFDSNLLRKKGGMPDAGNFLWNIFRHEISFDIGNNPPIIKKNKFYVVQDFKDFKDKSAEDFNWGVHLKEIAPKFMKIDPRCFNDADAKNRVAARVVINKGRLSTYRLDKVRRFKISSALGGGSFKRPLSNEVALDFYELEKLTILARPFGERDGRRLVIAASPGDYEIEIGNLCGKCLLPQEKNPKSRRKDKDFRWMYEICKDADCIPGALKDRVSLPVPQLDKPGEGAGLKPVECMRVSFGAYKPV